MKLIENQSFIFEPNTNQKNTISSRRKSHQNSRRRFKIEATFQYVPTDRVQRVRQKKRKHKQRLLKPKLK
jgi:hypothetical protein